MRRLLIALMAAMVLGGCGLDGAVAPGSDTGPAGSQRDSDTVGFEASAQPPSLSEREQAFLEAHERYMREHAAWVPIGAQEVGATLDAAHLIAARLAAIPEPDAFAFLAGQLADATAGGDPGVGVAVRTICSFATNAWLLAPSMTPMTASRISARAEHAAGGLTEFGEAGLLPDWLFAERDVRDSLIDIAALIYAGRDPDDEAMAAEVDYRIADEAVIRAVADLLVLVESPPPTSRPDGALPRPGRPAAR